ncbi:magnesium-translocating P-type ATPase [Tepidiforma thermophila]|uniref:Magnesium-transporting ATPase, P-type 1 n=1 Tax=Tepidiforma thermophila (strain KCTC 52669 / CGMCC 1.13589 / G233) TaxID=2761530 RepID=A0A2A9HB68_TEPT2|nr:magnesium-translocating P-type ATPase [Tepidiforma thermophila]PFG73217.1 Mg2+-importing ATPase [Tepidiforma thermophila]
MNQPRRRPAPALAEWAARDAADVLERLGSGPGGLSSAEAARRLAVHGPNSLPRGGHPALTILLRQLKNPLLGLLLAAVSVSFIVGERLDAAIIVAIVLLSVTLGFFDEFRADRSARMLEERLTRTARVFRDGEIQRVDAETLVPGDILVVEVGDIVAADARVIEANDLTVDESIITGESLPAEKRAAAGGEPGLATMLLSGTVVRSGRGRAVVVATGPASMVGAIAAGLHEAGRPTEFERGLRNFSLFLVGVTATLTAFILAANIWLGRGLLESLLFALAIAVGLTPQLLPAIVTVSLATGGRRLAERKVIVRRLVAIEDLGNLEVLFSDKTGTLTEGSIVLEALGCPPGSEDTLLGWTASWLLAGIHETSGNALDAVLAADERIQQAAAARAGWTLRDELPFSYQLRYAALAVESPAGERWVVVKGAAEELFARCTAADGWGEEWHPPAAAALARLADDGLRVIAVAIRPDDGRELAAQAAEGLRLVGFLGFSDPPRPEAKAAIERLANLGIEVKILTGDHPAVARHVCDRVGIPVRGVLTGADLEGLSPGELRDAVARTTVFARVTPEQKKLLVQAAQAGGRDVGFLGDGVNDAPAIRQADIGISVDTATDVAKAAADVVLLEKDLGVLADGVLEGRRTFANTVKYILMATSSNFGNMFSAAGASLFLDFLPMLPTQILLNNFLYDVSELTIPTDAVDEELTRRPAHWDLRSISRAMVVFGPVSSVFDYLTFALMLGVFNAGETRFQSGWFVESLCTQTLVIFVLRTHRVPFWRSRPSLPLLATTLGCVAVAAFIPYSPAAGALNFEPLPGRFLLALGGMVVTYLALVELAKRKVFAQAAAPAPVPAPVPPPPAPTPAA